MNKINSTLGFLFTSDFTKVLLIKKQKPEFHRGKLNGLGGKMESNESAEDCMIREVEEESGLITQKEDWHKIGTLEWQEWNVILFAGIYKGSAVDLSNPAEEVAWYTPTSLPENLLTNIPWLIPLCIDALKNSETLRIMINY